MLRIPRLKPRLVVFFGCRRFPALPPPKEKWETAWASKFGVAWRHVLVCREKGGEVGNGGGEGEGSRTFSGVLEGG